MAEQKFLGEAGLNVLVSEIKSKLDTHQTFAELWKADLYTIVDYYKEVEKIQAAGGDPNTSIYGYLAYTKSIYVLMELKQLVANLEDTDSIKIAVNALDSYINDNGVTSSAGLKQKLDDVFAATVDGGATIDTMCKVLPLSTFITSQHNITTPAEISASEVTNKFA